MPVRISVRAMKATTGSAGWHSNTRGLHRRRGAQGGRLCRHVHPGQTTKTGSVANIRGKVEYVGIWVDKRKHAEEQIAGRIRTHADILPEGERSSFFVLPVPHAYSTQGICAENIEQ